MNIADLDEKQLRMLLQQIPYNDLSSLSEEYGVTIPRWLTIKYRCVNCAKETNNKIQTINIKQANKTLTCPFCRKVSRMFTIRTEKEILTKKDFEFEFEL